MTEIFKIKIFKLTYNTSMKLQLGKSYRLNIRHDIENSLVFHFYVSVRLHQLNAC